MKENNIDLKLSEHLELLEFKKNILDGKRCVTSSNCHGDYYHVSYFTDSEIVEKLTKQLADSVKESERAEERVDKYKRLERIALDLSNQKFWLLEKVPMWIRWIFNAI